MPALKTPPIHSLMTTRNLAVTVNSLLILAIILWALNQHSAVVDSRYVPLVMPKAPEIEDPRYSQRPNEITDKAYALASWHLFGQTIEQAEETPLIALESEPNSAEVLIEDSDLDLYLKGVLSTDDDQGIALIETPIEGVQLFKVGDEVLPDYILESVFSDHILLGHNGRRLKLLLPKHRLNLQAKKQEGLESQSSPTLETLSIH
ncbi:MAG: type II secretion system protein N [Gammaproteobacteria bacterium]|nr:type II secretion system protein N [Gammaproteobacteria bacterium]